MNLIVVAIDSLRKDHVGAYATGKARTPSLDRLATRSLVFDRMYPEGLPTIPVRRAMFTGRRSFPSYDWAPWKGEIVKVRGWQRIRENEFTLAEMLRAQGYICGLVADTHHMFKPGQNFTRGFHAYTHVRGQVSDAYRSQPVPEELVKRYVHPELHEWAASRVLQHLRNNMGREREEDYLPARVFSTAANWLEENRAHEKFFLWVDCFDPHEPWDPPQEYIDMYDRGYTGREFILPREGDSSYLSEAELKHVRARYAAEVTFVDKWFGWFVERIHSLDLWDETIVVFFSDHGHPLGDRGVISKVPDYLYPDLVEVPFMLHIPGRTQDGSRTPIQVQFHDVAPTLLDALGVPAPEGYSFEGQSFLDALRPGAPSPRDHIVCGYSENALVQDDEWAYHFTQDPSLRRLYNIRTDPDRRENLFDEQPAVVRQMHERLTAVADPDAIRVDAETARIIVT